MDTDKHRFIKHNLGGKFLSAPVSVYICVYLWFNEFL